MMKRKAAIACLFVAVLMLLASHADAQSAPRLRVARRAIVVDQPRADGFVIGTVDAGVELEVLSRRAAWFEVRTPAGFPRPAGWIQASSIDVITPLPGPPPAPGGRLMIRGFATAGATLFNADDSFEAVLDSSTGFMAGGGAQVVLSNGVFVLGGIERFKKTGTRVLVSGAQVFTLPVDDTITIVPMQVTVGYRDFKYRRWAPYAGFGGGWQRLRETFSDGAPAVNQGHVSVHLLAGAERPLARWLSLAGEIQWTAVPDALGESGVSALVDEDDLGGVTFRVKVTFGL